MKNMTNALQKLKSRILGVELDPTMKLFLSAASLMVSLCMMVDLSPERFLGGSLITNRNMLLLLGLMIVGTLLIGRFFGYLFQNLSKGLGFVPPEAAISATTPSPRA